MASNWKGIVQFQENEDKRPLWQRRTNRNSLIRNTSVVESGSESGAGTTTSSGGSRSSSADDNRWDDRLAVPVQSRTIQQLSPIFVNRLSGKSGGGGGARFEDNPANIVGRSSSFRESISIVGLPRTPSMGQRRGGSPFNARHPAGSGKGSNSGDHLTADYVPSWRPDRRFSTPAVSRYRGSISRSPSPRFLGKTNQQPFEYFRNRAASLPASNASINAVAAASGTALKQRNQRSGRQPDHWPQIRSPSRVEQRFLTLTESADYDKIRSFVIGANGELVERGFCYRHRSETASSSSPGSTGPAASPNDDQVATGCNDSFIAPTSMGNVNLELTSGLDAAPRYSILVIGAPAVGKSSLLNLLKESQEFRPDDVVTCYSGDSEPGVATMVPVLICGEEVHLMFYEFSASDDHLWTSVPWQAAIVMYSISDKRSFSSAADTLYKIRAEQNRLVNTEASNDYSASTEPMPIILVANKIDLERHRQVHDQDGLEMAKSYACRFLDVSVELNHRVEDVLSHVMNEIWRCTISAYRQRHMKSNNTIPCSKGVGVIGEESGSTTKKGRRFSFRRSSVFKPKTSADGIGGKSRSSRASSLYAMPSGIPSAVYGASSTVSGNCNHSSGGGGGGLLNRLFGRRAVQSCEDLFARLLRG